VHSWQRLFLQDRCERQGFLLLQTSPVLPGCDSVGSWQTLFLQIRSGVQLSGASQRKPSQPNVQSLIAGM
jgi:hypothetical protein